MEASSFLICGMVFSNQKSLRGLTRTSGLRKAPSTLLLLNLCSLCVSGKSCLNSLLTRSYSSTGLCTLSGKFMEWFFGFVDAEGLFGVYLYSNGRAKLSFIISLHKDNLPVLEGIKNS